MKIFLPHEVRKYNSQLLGTIGKIMKYTCLVVFINCSLAIMLFAKNGSGQSLNQVSVKISIKNQTLDKAFEQIESQSRFKLVYNPVFINKSGVFTFSKNRISIEDALKQLLPEDLKFEQVGSNVLITEKPKPVIVKVADWPVTGKVTDEKGEPLPGVSVKIEGTNKGVVTDINGSFRISIANEKDRLSFSFLGYTTKTIIVGSQRNIEIQLLPGAASNLAEVVVVGYGTRKKSDVTGAVSVVNEKALREIPAGNIATALQGAAPGLQVLKSGGNSHPGSTPTIRIRGDRSLGATNDPLIIVDGIPFNGSLNDISQDDIVSVSVLKDASSTAIYGSRGANGVIIINTRRGKNQKPVISYSGYAGFNEVLGQFDLMNAGEFAEFKKWAKWNATSETARGTLYNNDFNNPQLSIDAFGDQAEYAAYKAGGNTDWQDLLYQKGLLTNHQVGLTGGSEKTQYDMSLGYYNSEGIYEKQTMDRYSLKLSIDHQLGKYVKLGISSLNSYTLINGLDVNPMSQALQASPFVGPYKDDGTLYGYLPGAGSNVWNPFADFEEGAIIDDKKRLSTFTSGYLQVDFNNGIKYKFNGGIQINPETQGKFYASATTKQLGDKSYGFNGDYTGYNYTLENLLTYDKTIAKHHTINFTGLFSLQESKSQWNYVHYRDLLADYIQYHNPKYASNITSDGSFDKWDILSYMGRLNYGFKDRYLLTLTVRADGSSRLAKGNKWHTFPSAALAWNIANEPFMKNLRAISALKLRGSYGTVGNTAIGTYETVGQLSDIKYNYGGDNVQGTYPTSAANVSLGWENTSSLNLGLDFGLFNGRINGSVEYYKQYTDDILLNQSLPPTSGYSSIRNNIGKTENRGLEFNIGSVNFSGDGKGSFFWSTDLNIFLNRSEITELSSGATRDIASNWFVGEPIGVFYDYKRLGIWQNTPEDIARAQELGLNVSGTTSVIGTVKVEDVNGDNRITSDDRIILGSRQPKYEGGFTNRFGYKNFDFSFVTYFKVGGLMKSGIHGGWMNTFEGKYNNLNVRYWTPDNNENYWPKPNAALQNPEYKSTLDIMDATYLKIRSITLGYTVPPSKLNFIGAKSARFYATASNPFSLFSDYVNKFGGLDPETNRSVDINTPALWSMLFGLNVSF